MPRARSRFVAPLRQGQRRLSSWASSPDETDFTLLAASGVDLQGTGNAALLAARPFTIVRVRGSVWIVSDQEAAQETPFLAFGLAIVSDSAAAAGAGSIPTPITEEDSDLWFAYTYAAAAGDTKTTNIERVDFESRAMRKVNNDQDVVSVAENGSSTHACLYLAKFRFLLKLH